MSVCFELAGAAITGRWRSVQNFPRWILLDDRFAAANLTLALARPGHKPPLGAFPIPDIRPRLLNS